MPEVWVIGEIAAGVGYGRNGVARAWSDNALSEVVNMTKTELKCRSDDVNPLFEQMLGKVCLRWVIVGVNKEMRGISLMEE